MLGKIMDMLLFFQMLGKIMDMLFFQMLVKIMDMLFFSDVG